MPDRTVAASPAGAAAKPQLTPALDRASIGLELANYAEFARIAPDSEVMGQLREVLARLQGQGCTLPPKLMIAVVVAGQQLLYDIYGRTDSDFREMVAYIAAAWLERRQQRSQGNRKAKETAADAHADWISFMLDQYFPAE